MIPTSLQNILNNKKIQPVLNDLQKTEIDALADTFPIATPFIRDTNFLTEIVEAFLKFYRWLFNIDAPFPISDLEMQFSMDLYRNYDQDLRFSLNPDDEKTVIPFSYVLKTWSAFLETQSPSTHIDISSLKLCAQYQEQIEKARESSWWKNKIMGELESSIAERIKALNAGQSIYIPGGVVLPLKEINAELGMADEGVAEEMLYEVRKSEDSEDLIFRVFNYSTKIDSLMNTKLNLDTILDHIKSQVSQKQDAFQEFQLTQDEILSQLRNLIEVQVIAHSSELNGFFDNLFYATDTAKTLAEGKDLSSMNLIQDNSTARFNKIFQEFKPKQIVKKEVEKYQVTTTSQTRSEKLFEIFAKSQDPECLLLGKLKMKATVFLDILEKTQAHLDKPSWRKWIKDNAVHLLKTIQIKAGNEPGMDKLIARLNEAVDQIAQKSADAPLTVPPGPDLQESNSSSFNEPVVLLATLRSMDELNRADEVKNQSYIPPLDSIDFSNEDLKATKAQFTLWMARCKTLSDEEKLDELGLLLNDAFEGIETAERLEFWDKIAMEEMEEWSEMLRDLGQFAAQVHFGTHTQGPLPQRLHQLLKTFQVCQNLVHKNAAQTHFDGFCTSMLPMRDILRDPYLDLGALGPSILKTLDGIEKDDLPKANLIKAVYRLEDKTPENQYYTKCYEKIQGVLGRDVEKDLTTASPISSIAGDFGQQSGDYVLPRQMIHLRQLNILTLMIAAKYRTLHFPGFMNRVKNVFRAIFAMLDKSDSERSYISLNSAVISEEIKFLETFLDSKKLPTSFACEVSVGPNFMREFKGEPKIESHDIYMHDYDEPLFFSDSKIQDSERGRTKPKDALVGGFFPSVYQETGEEIKTESIKHRIINGAVVNEDNLVSFEDGTPLTEEQLHDPKVVSFYGPTGQIATERKILNEHFRFPELPYDLSADLQLMQTSPEETRIQNTLAFFSKYPQLLTVTKNAIEWQRVFRLNLFRNASLSTFLVKHPNFSSVVKKSLKKMMASYEINRDTKGILFLMKIYDQLSEMVDVTEECQNNIERLTMWLEKADHDSSLIHHRRHIKQAFLAHYALSSDAEAIKKALPMILKCYFFICQLPQESHEENRTIDESIRYMMHKLTPAIVEMLKDKTACEKLIEDLVLTKTGKNIKDWQPSPQYPLYRSGIYEINLAEGLFYENGIAKTMLPQKIINENLIGKLFGKDFLHQAVVTHWMVEKDEETGKLYEFEYNNTTYRIVDFGAGYSEVYKSISGQWHQFILFQTLPDEQKIEVGKITQSELDTIGKDYKVKSVPEINLSGNCWLDVDNGTFVIQQASTDLYKGTFSSKKEKAWDDYKGFGDLLRYIDSLVQKNPDDSDSQILNPTSHEGMKRFLDLENPRNVLAKGKDNKIHELNYKLLGLSYSWNEQDKHWDCPEYPGYHLSDKKIEESLMLDTSFFDVAFQNYHLLENCTKQPKLLLVNEEYTKQKLDKHYRKMPVAQRGKESSKGREVYAFEVDPVQGLKTNDPNAYFYLAYVLFTQSKYKQALYYLRKAQDIKPGVSAKSETILNWFDNWKVKSSEAQTVLLYVHLLAHEQCKMLNTPAAESKQKDLAKKITEGCIQYGIGYMQNKIHPQLQLSEREFSMMPLMFFDNDVKQLDLEVQLLKAVISKHEQEAIPPVKIDKVIEYSEPIFDLEMELFTKENEKISSLESAKQKLSQAFSKKSAYAQELGKELIADLTEAEKNHQSKVMYLKNDVNVRELKKAIDDEQKEMLTQIITLKNSIIGKLNIPEKKEAVGIDQIIEKSKGTDAAKEKYLESVLFAYAAEDWSVPIKDGIIGEDQIEELEKQLELFLIASTQQQQYQKSLDLMQQFLDAKTSESKESIKIQLVQLLSAHRMYDPCNDPHRKAILMLEYSSKIIVRDNQIQNIREMLKGENLFKHEALAGGKTKVLRNIISKIKSDGISLSGVITHEPLMEMHHPFLEQIATQAYGDKAYRFEFSRDYPTNEAALLKILRNMLKTISQKGRIDCTKKDLLSLRHSFVLKMEALEFSDNPDTLHREMDLMGEIFQLLEQKARIGSDELDKVCDPEKEHNYALGGQKVNLQETKCETALQILTWIMDKDSPYAEIFKNNLQYRMTPKEVEEFLKWVSFNVRFKYLPKVDLEPYLTGLTYSNDIKQFYDSHINTQPIEIRNALVSFYTYLRMVIPDTLGKRGGVHFGRASDGLIIRPFEENGKCAERSEHGTEEETIWYTCLNYMDQTQGGVTIAQVAQLVRDQQSKAADKVRDALRLDPNSQLKYQDTEPAVRFAEEFDRKLDAVTPSDYEAIRQQIVESPKSLAEFMKLRVLSQITLSKEKIVGNAHDLVNLVDEFYGSSGTSNSYRALPDKIKKEAHLVKQAGVDGSLLCILLDTYEEGDILDYEKDGDAVKVMVDHLYANKGSALVDLGPAFAGKVGKEIVREIAQGRDKKIPIQFIDRDDKVKIYFPDKNSIELATESVDIDNVITVFDQAHTRGTDLVLSNQSVGYVTVGPKTKFSDFLQAVMRMRKLGKGQKVRYLIDASVSKQLKGKLTLANLIAQLNENESKPLKKLHRKSEKQKIRSLAKVAIFKQLHRIDKKDRLAVWKKVRDYFIEPTQESLANQGIPENKKKSLKVLKALAKSEKTKLETLKNEIAEIGIPAFEEALQGAIGDLAKKESGETLIDELYLPKKDYTSKLEQDMQQEVQREQEKEQETEQDQEQDQDQALMKNDLYSVAWHPIEAKDPGDLLLRVLGKADGHYHQLSDHVPFYDSKIYFTENVWHTGKGMKPWGVEGLNDSLTPNQTRINRFVIMVKDNSVHVLLGTQKDFDHVLERMGSGPQSEGIDYYVYNLFQDDLDGHETRWKEYSEDVQLEIAKMIAQVKLLNGEVDLLHSEKAPVYRQEARALHEHLEIYVKDGKADPVVLEANVKKYLRAFSPYSVEDYPTSTLAGCFKALK